MNNKAETNLPTWKQASAMPVSKWAGVGNIKAIYTPCKDLLNRWQDAHKAAYGGKRPNLTQAVTYAVIKAYKLIVADCDDMDKLIREREEKALSSETSFTN